MQSNLKNQYDEQGFVYPVPIFTRAEIAVHRDKLLAVDAELDLMRSDYRCKSNVLFDWLDEITRHPRLIECLTGIIGPDFHCWDTLFWIKNPGDGKVVSLHQDATYWNLTPKHKPVTAWLAFDDVTPEHGSIQYVPGSHKNGIRHHDDIKTDTNLLMRGQTVSGAVNGVVTTQLNAGEVLLHHPFVIHGSSANTATTRRLACGMVFVPTECQPILQRSPETTILVSGEDRYGHMLQDPRPGPDFAINERAWRLAYDRQHDNYYAMQEALMTESRQNA